MGLRERLPMLLELRQENLPVLEANAQDLEKDRNGCSSSSLANALRFLGVAEYVVNGDIEAFREKLGAAAKLRNVLLERYCNGDPISDSYVTMLSYKHVLNALAAHDLGLAQSIANKMGGRNVLENEHDHPFDLAFGYCLKAVVEMDQAAMDKWCARFLEECASDDNADFRGYAQALDAIRRNDSDALSVALMNVVKSHANQCKTGGAFNNMEDETLCVWGVAIAYLANTRGLSVTLESSIIPQELVA